MERLDEIRSQLASVSDPLALLEGFFAHAPVGLQLFDPGGHCLLTNQAFRDLFGAEPPPGYNVLEDDVVAARGILGLIRRAFAGETVTTPPIWYDPRELRQVRVPDGRRVAVGSSMFALHDRLGRIAHVAIIFKDVTAEMRAREEAERTTHALEAKHEALRRSEEQFRAVFEHAPLGIVSGDLPLGRVRFNPAIERMLGYDADEIARLGVEGVTHPDDFAADLARFQRLERGEIDGYEMEKRYLRKDGSILWGRLYVSLGRDRAGKPQFAIGMVEDVTARRQAREERERLLVELRGAVAARDEFLTMASHELRTPLTTLTLGVDLLKDMVAAAAGRALAPSELEPTLAALGRQVTRLNRLVDGLLDVSRITTGAIHLAPEPTDLSAVIAEALGRLAQDVARSGSEVALRLPGPIVGHWDPLRLDQIVTNLLSNALKYGMGRPIAVTAESLPGRAVMRVADRGPGIAPADRARIFERFERAASANVWGGLGLGLWIVRQIVAAMGGSIEVESIEGEGSTFVVELPLRSS